MSNECIYEHRICRTHREQLRKKKKKTGSEIVHNKTKKNPIHLK